MNAPTPGGPRPSPTRLAGLIAGLAAAVGAVVLDGELEITLFMAAAVVSALAAFDASLDRHANAFWPWLLISCGVLAKAVPTVLARLLDLTSASFERAQHLGSALMGGCVLAAFFLLARPPAGARHRSRITGMLVLAPVVAGLAGAVGAHAGPSAFASSRAARFFETIDWGVAGGIVVAVALAAASLRVPTRALGALSVGALGAAVLIAQVASGADPDLGWWALDFVAIAFGALAVSPATLGRDSGRRTSVLPAAIAVVAAVVGVQAGVVALQGDAPTIPTVLLAISAIALVAVGLPIYRSTGIDDTPDEPGRAEMLELLAERQVTPDESTLDLPLPSGDPWPETATAPSRVPVAPAGSAFRIAVGASIDVTDDGESSPSRLPRVAEPAASSRDRSADRASNAEPSRARPKAAMANAFTAATRAEPATEAPAQTEPAQAVPAQTVPAQTVPAQTVPTETEPAQTVPAQTVPAQTVATQSEPGVTEAGPVATHLVDPATGLESASGLEQALIEAFSRPRAAGEVAILMVALRDLERHEREHGRVAASQAVAELARRFRHRMADARVARFSTDAFAALLDGEPADPEALIDRCTSVLIELLDPVTAGAHELEIDVAAGMAQCYDGEDVASFITRANQGLQRAVDAGEPTMVAMP